MSTKTYDYLFKLLLIGDSGKYLNNSPNSSFLNFFCAIRIILSFYFYFVCYRSGKDLHLVQILRKQLQYDLHLDHR